jgi:hypothetical protein
MTLLDARPPKQRPLIIKLLPAIIIVVVIVGALLIYRFKNYPEERAVARYLTTLSQGNYHEAYHLWQAAPSYSFENFMHDWGPQGDYGKIRHFEILDSRSKGSSNVIVTVRINNQDPPLDIVVDRNTKALAYSPF